MQKLLTKLMTGASCALVEPSCGISAAALAANTANLGQSQQASKSFGGSVPVAVVEAGVSGREQPVVTVMLVVRRERLSHHTLLSGGDACQKSLAGGVLRIEGERLLRRVLSARHMAGCQFGLSQMAEQVC